MIQREADGSQDKGRDTQRDRMIWRVTDRETKTERERKKQRQTDRQRQRQTGKTETEKHLFPVAVFR